MKPWEETWKYNARTGRIGTHERNGSDLENLGSDGAGHLAAAAPELYRALVMAREDLKLYADIGEPAHLFSAIDAALAKARGA